LILAKHDRELTILNEMPTGATHERLKPLSWSVFGRLTTGLEQIVKGKQIDHDGRQTLLPKQAPPARPHSLAWSELLGLTVLALVVRLAWVLFGSWEAGDSSWYLAVARNIAFHHVFSSSANGSALVSTAYRPPLYPAFIASLWLGDSAPVLATLLVQAVLGATTVSFIYLIAREGFDRRVAVLAAAGMVLAPMTGRFTAVILSETLFTFLLTLGVFLWSRNRYALTGFVFGLATLARITLLPFLGLLPLLTLLPAWRPQRRAYATIVLLSIAVASIWIARNAIVFKQFVPIAASGFGTNLLLGTLKTKEADDVAARKEFLTSVDQKSGVAGVDETAADRLRLRAALQRIADNPGQWIVARLQQYPRLFIDSGSYLFAGGGMPFRSAAGRGLTGQVMIRIAFISGNVLVFFFALFAIVAERARFVSLSHITLFPIFLCAISLPLWIEPRYGLPMMPLVAILAAVGLFDVVKLVSRFLMTTRH
jgi:4-amino-4-deoxy-L-arabinose transferase-like glycosyltransferase